MSSESSASWRDMADPADDSLHAALRQRAHPRAASDCSQLTGARQILASPCFAVGLNPSPDLGSIPSAEVLGHRARVHKPPPGNECDNKHKTRRWEGRRVCTGPRVGWLLRRRLQDLFGQKSGGANTSEKTPKCDSSCVSVWDRLWHCFLRSCV